MANAKTYNDLNQAAEVNDTDKLALAQSDKQELVTATVGQVAQKVANIVSTDQVTEIVTDLGLGKQILAQTLQDKGVNTTASDTLSQMATKLAAVDVVGALEFQVAVPALTYYSNSLTKHYVSYCGKIDAFIRIDTSGGVVDIGKFNADKSFQANITFQNDIIKTMGNVSDVNIGISNNNTYIALGALASSGKALVVYQIDWEQNIATLMYSHIYTNSNIPTGAPRGLYVTDDGQETFFFYYGTYSSKMVYFNNSTQKELHDSNGVSTSYISTDGDGYYDENTNAFYFTGAYQSVNTKWGLGRTYVTITEDTISFSTPEAIIPSPTDIRNGGASLILKDFDMVVCCGNKNPSSSDFYAYPAILRVFKLSTGELINSYECPVPYTGFSQYTVIINNNILVQKKGDKYYIGVGNGNYVSLDANGNINNVLDTKNILGNNVGLYLASMSTSQQYLGIPYNAGGTYIFMDTIAGCNNFPYISGYTSIYPTETLNKCIIGFWLKRNNQYSLFQCPFSKTAYAAGAYDIENKKVLLDLPEAN